MKNIPNCEPELLQDLSIKITELANLWLKSDLRPDCLPELKSHWDELINNWAKDDSMPLFIRKQNLGRGSIILHNSGRELIPTDNSPAIWSYSSCLLEKNFNINCIKKLLSEDKIDIALTFKTDELTQAKYKCKLSKDNINNKDWKLAHINPVGIKKRLNKEKIKELEIEILVNHFINFMSPSNMFLFPKKWSGIAEAPELIDVFKV